MGVYDGGWKKHIYGLGWARDQWCPPPTGYASWYTTYGSKWQSQIANRNVAQHIDFISLRFTCSNIEYNQGDDSFDDIGEGIKQIRAFSGNKPVHLIWTLLTHKANLTTQGAVAPWMRSAGWAFKWTKSANGEILQYYRSSTAGPYDWLIQKTTKFFDWIDNGVLPGTSTRVRDCVHSVQLDDESAAGNWNNDPAYTNQRWHDRLLAWYQHGRTVWPNGPLAVALNWYPPGDTLRQVLRDWAKSTNTAMCGPDINAYMTTTGTNANVHNLGASDTALGQHAWMMKYFAELSSVYSVQFPAFTRNDMVASWNDAVSKGIPFALTNAEADARGPCYSGALPRHPWPIDHANWIRFTQRSAVLFYENTGLAALLAESYANLSPTMPPAGAYFDGTPPAPSSNYTAPMGINCGGSEVEIGGTTFVALTPPGPIGGGTGMGTQSVTGEVTGTDFTALFAQKWTWFNSTAGAVLTLPFDAGTYDVYFLDTEHYWNEIERAYDIEVQGSLVVDQWCVFEDVGFKVAAQKKIAGVVVTGAETLTIEFKQGDGAGDYADPKPTMSAILIQAAGSPDPGLVAGTPGAKPGLITNIVLTDATVDSLSFSWDAAVLGE